jgi:16S rRNA A1518/A1519 N6-dimethyltransferase RsmA/KsgA/DIM1 with predicted DNA glycosylase/AP lyase activity
MNPDDPQSAQCIVADYVRVLEQHATADAYPASARTLPYPKPTIKSAIVTCVTSLRQTDQLTEELLEFLESAYVALADYLDDELVRAMTEYREAAAALAAETNTASEKVQTPAWQRVAATSRLAGEIARSIVEETTTLRREFRASA